MTKFLTKALRLKSEYEIAIIELATSMCDAASVRLLSPATWFRGARVTDDWIDEFQVSHVGAIMTEFEFQRYRPRRVLTEILNRFDLIQVVAGTPAWAFVTRDVLNPVVLFTASTSKFDQAALLSRLHGPNRYWRSVMTAINHRIEQRTLSEVDAVMAESDYTLELLRTRMPTDRLVLGVPGVDIYYLSPAPLYAENGYWLWVGRLNDPRKNILLLLDGYSRLCKRAPRTAGLVLAGRGEWLPEYANQAAALGIADRVKIQCNVPAERLIELYRGASAFVLSSDEEGLGMVILEAMACGLPVISTDCGGPRTAVVAQKTGLLSPVGDARALGLAMEYLWEQPDLRREMGQAGRQMAVERFSIEAAGKVYLDQYERILALSRV